jgi:hypothetical protein
MRFDFRHVKVIFLICSANDANARKTDFEEGCQGETKGAGKGVYQNFLSRGESYELLVGSYELWVCE